MKGWECPVCGKGLAPWVEQCSCGDEPSLEPAEELIPRYYHDTEDPCP